MVDALKIAEDLERGSDGFTATQAKRLATAIAFASDGGRFKEVEASLRSLEVKVGIQAVVTTLTPAAVLAVFWQLYTLRGELSGFAAATGARLQVIEQRSGMEGR